MFHYQSSLSDRRLVDPLLQGAAYVYWIRVLHDEVVRFFAEYLAGLMVTDEQRVELRGSIEAMVHWYPYREVPELESFERTLRYGWEVLAKHPDDHSEERQEFERSLEAAGATLRKGRNNWTLLRAQMLRDAGVE